MTDEQRFNLFIQKVKSSKTLWLLQASDGLFAILEGETGTTFLPVWSDEKGCEDNVSGPWIDYAAIAMPLSEMLNWCDELQADSMMLGIEPQTDGKILPLAAEVFKNIFSQH